MKKLIYTLLMSSVLSGCAVFTGTNSDTYEGKVPKGRVELACPKCNKDDVNKYFVNNPAANYELKIESKNTVVLDSNDFWTFLGVLSLGLIPTDEGHSEDIVSGELFDKKAGKSISLGKVETQSDFWFGWVFLPAMPFCTTWDEHNGSKVEQEGAKELLKRAAFAIYDPSNPVLTNNKWHCSEYLCRYNEIMGQRKTTADDVLWVAKNTSAYYDFQKAKDKLDRPLSEDDNCTATRYMLKRQIISKDTQRYWALIDFYKDNCNGTDGYFGMTKERLISEKGVPLKGYRINADTEVVSYSSLSRDGESVITTTYTIDRGIVTSVK